MPSYLYNEISLNLPTNGSASNTTSTGSSSYPSLYLGPGVIRKILVTVPTGANGAVFFRIKINGVPEWPNQANTVFSNLTNVVAQAIEWTFPLNAERNQVDIEGYNLSSQYSYTITIGVIEEVA